MTFHLRFQSGFTAPSYCYDLNLIQARSLVDRSSNQRADRLVISLTHTALNEPRTTNQKLSLGHRQSLQFQAQVTKETPNQNQIFQFFKQQSHHQIQTLDLRRIYHKQQQSTCTLQTKTRIDLLIRINIIQKV